MGLCVNLKIVRNNSQSVCWFLTHKHTQMSCHQDMSELPLRILNIAANILKNTDYG